MEYLLSSPKGLIAISCWFCFLATRKDSESFYQQGSPLALSQPSPGKWVQPQEAPGGQGVEGQGDSRGESSLHMSEFSFARLVREAFVLPRHLPG